MPDCALTIPMENDGICEYAVYAIAAALISPAESPPINLALPQSLGCLI